MTDNKIRVLIIEPSAIVQQGLREIIEANDQFTIVGSLSDINRIEERLTTMRVDIVVLNPTIVDYHRRHHIRNIIPDKPLVALVLAYIGSDTLRQFQSIIGINDSQSEIWNRLTEASKMHSQDEQTPENSELSDREKEILISVAKGLMNKEIALLHNISIHTVISHRKNISRKTGIKSVSGLVVYALLNNLIDQNEIQ